MQLIKHRSSGIFNFIIQEIWMVELTVYWLFLIMRTERWEKYYASQRFSNSAPNHLPWDFQMLFTSTTSQNQSARARNGNTTALYLLHQNSMYASVLNPSNSKSMFSKSSNLDIFWTLQFLPFQSIFTWIISLAVANKWLIGRVKGILFSLTRVFILH